MCVVHSIFRQLLIPILHSLFLHGYKIPLWNVILSLLRDNLLNIHYRHACGFPCMMLQCNLTQLYSVGLTQINTVTRVTFYAEAEELSLCTLHCVTYAIASFPDSTKLSVVCLQAMKSLGMRLACVNITTVGSWITCRRLPEAGTLGVNKMYNHTFVLIVLYIISCQWEK